MAHQEGPRPSSQKTAMAAIIVVLVVTCIIYGAMLFNSNMTDHEIADVPGQAEVIEVPPAPPTPPPPPAPLNAEVTDEIFVVVEQMPELVGGLGSIQKNIKYPEVAKKAGIEGRVFIQFVVDKNGNVQNPQIVRGIGGGCDEEAVRALSMAKFKPGMQRGEIVNVKMSIPVTFKLA